MNITGGPRSARGTKRSTVLAAAALLGGAGLLLVAGCSSGSASSSRLSASHGSGQAAHAGVSVNGAAAAPRVPAASGSFGPEKSASQSARLLLSSQSIIFTANMTVRSPDVSKAAAKVTTLVQSAGGYISAEQALNNPGDSAGPQVSLTLKIPVARYQSALTALAAALGRQLSLTTQATNVTQQVADVSSRVASQQAAIAQLRALLRHAGSVGQLLSVQDQINADESALEALLAQQRALAHETTYGTVSVLLVSTHRHVVKKHRNKSAAGFLGGLSRGWRAFTLAVSWVLTAIGAVLPFAVIAAALAALGYAARRRLLRRRARPSAT